MVFSFLQFELRALSAVRVKPGTGQGSLLRGEVEPLDANRSACPVAYPAACRIRVLATLGEVRSLEVKFTVSRIAASDELFGPFSAAILATPLFFAEMDIQAAERAEGNTFDE
jgi:hypothetical protein